MTANSRNFEEELEAKKRASVAQLLFKCARLINEDALARWKPFGERRIRPAHMSLVPHISLDGTRQTELAEAIGISKQAVGQLVTELEEMGVLSRERDPSDGRAKLVRFTRRGRKAMLEGLSLLGEIEEELSAAVGERRMRELHRALLAVHDHLTGDGGD